MVIIDHRVVTQDIRPSHWAGLAKLYNTALYCIHCTVMYCRNCKLQRCLEGYPGGSPLRGECSLRLLKHLPAVRVFVLLGNLWRTHALDNLRDPRGFPLLIQDG